MSNPARNDKRDLILAKALQGLSIGYVATRKAARRGGGRRGGLGPPSLAHVAAGPAPGGLRPVV